MKGVYEVCYGHLGFWNAPENVIASDSNEIIATACISESNESKIVTLNKVREIKIYKDTSMIKRLYINFSIESFNKGIPLIYPQFYFNL